MGFELVSGPFVVLLLDPFSGVILVNICGIVSASSVCVRTVAVVVWPSFRQLASGAGIGTAPGAHIASDPPTPPLQILIGALIVVALVSSRTLGRLGRRSRANIGARLGTG